MKMQTLASDTEKFRHLEPRRQICSGVHFCADDFRRSKCGKDGPMDFSLPAPIADHIDQFKHAVAVANLSDGKMLRSNALAFVQNALGMVAITPEMESAGQEAVHRAMFFAGMLGDLRYETGAGTAEKERAREEVLVAIEKMRESLIGARPSAMATGLGISW
jgi:phage-related protein